MMPWRRGRSSAPALADAELRTAWQLVAVLCQYPDEHFPANLPALQAAAASLPDAVGGPLVEFLQGAAVTDLRTLQEEFVATFDHTRKCSLYLTYASCGDTRRRGVALVRFKQAYRQAGLVITDEELPDHLSVVLTCGAAADRDLAWRLLNDHRAAIELLRIALTERRSRWLLVVAALVATLPPLQGDEQEAVAALIAAGPPEEDVGLAPYSMDPRLNPHPNDDLAADWIGARP